MVHSVSGWRETAVSGALVFLCAQGCGEANLETATPSPSPTTEAPSSAHPEGWGEASHGGDAPPDYEKVFPSGVVQRLEVTIAPEDWQTMVDQLTTTGGIGQALSLSLDEVSATWPLIRYLMDEPTFEAAYREHIADLLEGAFAQEATQARILAEHDLIAPYVVGSGGEQAPYTNLTSPAAFEGSASVLIQHVADRHTAAREYLE